MKEVYIKGIKIPVHSIINVKVHHFIYLMTSDWNKTLWISENKLAKCITWQNISILFSYYLTGIYSPCQLLVLNILTLTWSQVVKIQVNISFLCIQSMQIVLLMHIIINVRLLNAFTQKQKAGTCSILIQTIKLNTMQIYSPITMYKLWILNRCPPRSLRVHPQVTGETAYWNIRETFTCLKCQEEVARNVLWHSTYYTLTDENSIGYIHQYVLYAECHSSKAQQL